jgi:cysteine desulfurase
MHYLDHAATTPIVPAAKAALLTVLEQDFGNPSSIHAYGRAARRAVEDAREQVAAAVGASPAEITFTAGGTEADNLAIKGVATKFAGNGNHLVTTAFEHHAVLESMEHLQHEGFDVSFVEVENNGLVDPTRVGAAVRKGTLLASVMAVNNEIGTVQDLSAVVAAVKDVNAATLVHSDAVQALGNIPVEVHSWGIDLASFSAHKLGGPKGVGALYIATGVALAPLFHGGGHERGLRSGTLNAAGIAAFGAAAEVAAAEVKSKAERLLRLRTRLLQGVLTAIPDARINGDLDRRVPGNLNLSFPGASGESLLLLLDAAGIACSSGSACQSGAIDPSHVLLAIGLEPPLADASIRFSFGRASSDEDVDAVLEVLPEIVERARKVA